MNTSSNFEYNFFSQTSTSVQIQKVSTISKPCHSFPIFSACLLLFFPFSSFTKPASKTVTKTFFSTLHFNIFIAQLKIKQKSSIPHQQYRHSFYIMISCTLRLPRRLYKRHNKSTFTCEALHTHNSRFSTHKNTKCYPLGLIHSVMIQPDSSFWLFSRDMSPVRCTHVMSLTSSSSFLLLN